MLHIISYDLKASKDDYEKLYALLEEMGDAYKASESTLFLHTSIEAGLVDSAMRGVVSKESTFVVVDITGVSEEKYFGRVSPRTKGDAFWTWIKANNN